MITAGTCRGTGCRFGAFSWSVIEVGGIWDITIFIKVISFGLSLFFTGVIGLGLLGVIWGGFITCQQVDFKRLVAYSSVAHMGVVVISLFSFSI